MRRAVGTRSSDQSTKTLPLHGSAVVAARGKAALQQGKGGAGGGGGGPERRSIYTALQYAEENELTVVQDGGRLGFPFFPGRWSVPNDCMYVNVKPFLP